MRNYYTLIYQRKQVLNQYFHKTLIFTTLCLQKN